MNSKNKIYTTLFIIQGPIGFQNNDFNPENSLFFTNSEATTATEKEFRISFLSEVGRDRDGQLECVFNIG